MTIWYNSRRAKVGILEEAQDPFILDLAGYLGDVEFVKFDQHVFRPSPGFKVIVDRASHRFPYLREMLKGLSLDGCYVLNNPFAASATNKLVDMHLSRQLGIPVPKTMVLPDLSVLEEFPDAVAEPSWDGITREIGFPCILKPFDGYGWSDVFEVQSLDDLKQLYVPERFKRILLAQQLIRYTHYYRVFCIGQKDVLFVRWVPRPLGLGEYATCDSGPIETIKDKLTTMTMELNAALDLDINVLEWCLDREGNPWLIDAFNEVPDIPKHLLPGECYRWLVEHLVGCVREKLYDPAARNRSAFHVPRMTDAGAACKLSG